MKTLLVVGCGKRVIDFALPAIESLDVELCGIYARSEREICFRRGKYLVKPLNALRHQGPAFDVLYLAVPHDSVSACLSILRARQIRARHIVLETPIPGWNGQKLKRLCEGHFEHIWTGEDCAFNPLFTVVRDCIETSSIGYVIGAFSFLSAFKHHGIATFRCIFDAEHINSAKTLARFGNSKLVKASYSNRRTAVYLEPRYYPSGKFIFYASLGELSDFDRSARNRSNINLIRTSGVVSGIEAGDCRDAFSEWEMELFKRHSEGTSIGSNMHALKAVGVHRMFQHVFVSGQGYSFKKGLEDAFSSACIERFGFYNRLFSGPLHAISSVSRRFLRGK